MKNKLMLIFGCAFLFFLMPSIGCKVEKLNNLSLSSIQMERLLTAATDSAIIFQFYHDSSNVLTLNAWPKKKGMVYNAGTDREILEINKGGINLSGQKVLLANFCLDTKVDTIEANRFKLLLDAYNTKHYPYYQFVPKIKPVDLPEAGLYVQYEIYGADEANKIILANRITDTPNPSPPR